MRHFFQNFCKEPEKIENYEKAKADDFIGWNCHQRLETHTSDGERRLVNITKKELKALGMYWYRPADELIFLTTSEHNTLHHKGKLISEETKNKMREARKGKHLGKDNPFYGKHHSEEAKKKMSEINKVRMKGMRWFNNGKINTRAKECPDGFTPGRLRK